MARWPMSLERKDMTGPVTRKKNRGLLPDSPGFGHGRFACDETLLSFKRKWKIAVFQAPLFS